jgi:hypothetical protein
LSTNSKAAPVVVTVVPFAVLVELKVADVLYLMLHQQQHQLMNQATANYGTTQI